MPLAAHNNFRAVRYDGFRAVKHALLTLADAGTLFVAGNLDAEHIVFLCAGFPDDHSSFIPLGRRLAAEGCLVGVSCMPEYDRDTPLRPQGYEIDEVAECFAQAVAALKVESRASQPKLTLVVHDWGSPFGFAHSNAFGCDKLVVFDVLPTNPVLEAPDRMYFGLVHILYQSTFAIAFRLWRLLPILGHVHLTFGLIVIFQVLSRWLSPMGLHTDHANSSLLGGTGLLPWQSPDTTMAGSRPMTPFRCYPYYHALKKAFSQKAVGMIAEKMSFDTSLAKQPICYIFGAEKNTQFHCRAHLEKLEAAAGSVVVRVEGAGHWLYKHKPDECFEAVRKFILG